MLELRIKGVKVYMGWNEDYSPGDSISDRSEKLLQRGMGERSMYMWILVQGQYMQSSTYFLQKLSASSQGEVVTVKEFSAFLDNEDIW